MSTLTIRIPEKLRRDLEALSRETDQSVSDLVRESLRKYVLIEGFRAARRKIVPYAEAAGYFTDEDVFKDIS